MRCGWVAAGHTPARCPVGGLPEGNGAPAVMEEQVRSQPWFGKAMGNPIVMGALGVIASKLLRR